MQSESVENIFARAWSLLTGNPVILVPGLIVGIAVGIIQWTVTPHFDRSDPTAIAANLAASVIALGIAIAVGVLAFLATQAYTVGMAGAAWERGKTSLADGARSFREDAGRLLGVMLLIALIGILVGIVTAGLGWFVVLFFAMYAVPAVVLDNYSPFAALQLSFTIATKRFVPSLIIVALLLVIGLVVGFLIIPLAFIPLVGPVVASVVNQCIVAYTAMVVVGEYLATHRAPDIVPPAGPVI